MGGVSGVGVNIEVVGYLRIKESDPLISLDSAIDSGEAKIGFVISSWTFSGQNRFVG